MATKKAVANSDGDDNEPGACYVTDKQSGIQRCKLLTEAECSAQGGVFYGGPCGPLAETLTIAPKKSSVAKKAAKKKSAKKSAKSSPKRRPLE
jgi:hypothetical protein